MKLKNAELCHLWKGSILEIAQSGGWLTEEMVRKRITGLESCDDLTAKEKELLAALKKDLK